MLSFKDSRLLLQIFLLNALFRFGETRDYKAILKKNLKTLVELLFLSWTIKIARLKEKCNIVLNYASTFILR